VPAAMVDVAKRLCTDGNIPVAEIHSYHWIGDEMRFLPAYKAPADGRTASAKAPAAAPKVTARPSTAKVSSGQDRSPKKKAKSSKPARRKTAGKTGRKPGRSLKRK
jgi:hypothetical protein